MNGPIYSPPELLARLIAFDTTSHKGNLPLIRFIEDYLAQHGVASTLIPSPEGDKASLFASIGPAGIPGIGLSGHTDVVPADASTWRSDPFRLVRRGDRLYGRGTADMKGFLACALVAVPDFVRRPLRTPIVLLFSYDEEVGCLGVRPMIAQMGGRLAKPRLVIVGEPTAMAVVDAHKGPVRWSVTVRGRAAHSSMAPLGVNAITHAGRLIAELDLIAAELAAAQRNRRFDPPFATLQVTTIEGGSAANIVPAACTFGFEVRALPDLDVGSIEKRLRAFARTQCLAEMQAVAPECGIDIIRVNSVPSFDAGAGSPAVSLALQLAGQNATHAVSYATEAGLFQEAGAPSVVCGPGDIAQAHTADEWIATAELDACMAFMARLGDWAEQ